MLRDKKIIIVFVILIITSPWLSIFIKNKSKILEKAPVNKISHKEVLLDETNTLRGELDNVAPDFLARGLVNKHTIRALDFLDLYFQNFEPHYLFFVGTNDKTENTGFNGPLYLSLLPLFLYGILNLNYKNFVNKILVFCLLISPVLSLYYLSPKSLILNIPLFLTITLFASFGFVKLFKIKKAISYLLIFYYLFEMSKFFHNFNNHF